MAPPRVAILLSSTRFSFLRCRSWRHHGSGHPDPDYMDVILTGAAATPCGRLSSYTRPVILSHFWVFCYFGVNNDFTCFRIV
jgi:hypothetical protein